jgi:NADPH-dependent ferric siderophore reductase
MRVTAAEYINPHIKRIRFHGDIKALNFQIGYAMAVRVSGTEYRNYTVSYHDMEKGIVELIAHLHGAAPGSLYIDNLAVGDEIRLIPPRGKKMYDHAVKQHYFFGDETSLGLACSLQSALQKDDQRYRFYFELDAQNQNVPGLLGLDNYTLVHKKITFFNEALINELPFFRIRGWQDSNFLITGNARAVLTIRKVLKQNTISGNILAQAYWAEGKTGL